MPDNTNTTETTTNVTENTVTNTEPETTTDTSNTEVTRTANDPATAEANRGEIIEVEWESVKHIYEFRQKLQEMENYFANMCLRFEKDKANIMSQITFGQNDLYTMAEQLQKSHNVDTNLTYELKLPASTGEKGYFLRKE